MRCHRPGFVAAVLLSAACYLQASADGGASADDNMVSLLQTSHSLGLPAAKSGGQQDLVMVNVPYNFGHTVSVNAIKNGIKWGDCGQPRAASDSATCLGQLKSQITGCRLMTTPGKHWPKDIAERYFGNKTAFGILRDPFERLVAQFRGSGMMLCPEARAKCDVNAGVKQIVEQYKAAGQPYMAECMFLPQAEFFDPPFGATVVLDNRLFPVSANKLLEAHGYSDLRIRQNDISHVSGCDDKWSGDLDPKTQALVREVYHRDFELLCKNFGYCDDFKAVCLTHVHGMCPEQRFQWDSKSQVYLEK